MLLELAIGDAYGAGFEYANERVERFNDLSGYVKHPRHSGTKPGMYTDDTQMSLAIAELIVDGVEWTPLNLASKFVEVFKRDQREGYSGHFYNFLNKVQDGQQFLAEIKPDSEKSGAAMRATPIGIFPTIAEVLEKCKIQAAVTHNTPLGIGAACASALTAHYFIYDLGSKAELGEFLEAHVPERPYPWISTYQGKVKSKGWMSVWAAVTALRRNDTLSSLLRDCINFKGDVDTVATIALGAAANSREYAQDLPPILIDTLENRTYGKDYIVALDQKLMALVRKT